MSEQRQIIEMAMTSASMAAFMMPGPGVAVGIALMTAPMLMNMFFPIEPDEDYETTLVEKSDLKIALNKAVEQISDNNLKRDLKQRRIAIETLYESATRVWESTYQNVRGENVNPASGPMFLSGELSKTQERNWLAAFDNFKSEVTVPLPKIIEIKNWLDDEQDLPDPRKTLDIYLLAGSTWALYCKFCLAWEYNTIYREFEKAQNAHAAKVAKIDIEDAIVNWELEGGEESGIPMPELPPAPEVPPELDDIQSHSIFVNELLKYLPSFADFAEEAAKHIKSLHTKRERVVNHRLGQIELREYGSGRHKTYYWYDAKTGRSSRKERIKSLAERKLRSQKSRAKAAVWKAITEADKTDDFSVEKADEVLAVVSVWRKIIYDFSTTAEEKARSSKLAREALETVFVEPFRSIGAGFRRSFNVGKGGVSRRRRAAQRAKERKRR